MRNFKKIPTIEKHVGKRSEKRVYVYDIESDFHVGAAPFTNKSAKQIPSLEK